MELIINVCTIVFGVLYSRPDLTGYTFISQVQQQGLKLDVQFEEAWRL